MKVKVKPLSCVRLFATPRTVAHGIFQARVLEQVAISFSRGPSRPRDQTWVSLFAGRGFAFQRDGNILKLTVVVGTPLRMYNHPDTQF